MIKYTCKKFHIQIEDLVEQEEYDSKYPDNLFRGSVYHNGICWNVFHRATLKEAKETASFWVDMYV